MQKKFGQNVQDIANVQGNVEYSAGLSDERLNSLLDKCTRADNKNDNYAEGYIAYMPPLQYLHLTTQWYANKNGKMVLDDLFEESGKLDKNDYKKSYDTHEVPYLIIVKEGKKLRV